MLIFFRFRREKTRKEPNAQKPRNLFGLLGTVSEMTDIIIEKVDSETKTNTLAKPKQTRWQRFRKGVGSCLKYSCLCCCAILGGLDGLDSDLFDNDSE